MRARQSDQQAWDALVGRYAPLVWSICRRYRLDRTDAEDVAQTIWLRLVDQLDRLREPDALPGWLVTTTRRECLQVLDRAHGANPFGPVLAAEDVPDQQAATAEQELLAAERRAALREAITGLPPHCQRLLALLIQDPPVSYAEISARLGISVGSIGPIRSRCLAKLRRHPAIAALINPEPEAQQRRLTGTINSTTRPSSVARQPIRTLPEREQRRDRQSTAHPATAELTVPHVAPWHRKSA
jgi:RNA polymerase sigma factor (sigma-70 family)